MGKLIIHITNVITGETVTHLDEDNLNVYETEEDAWSLVYFWTEGNFGCDCNRALMFDRVKGVDEDQIDVSCGESLYDIRIEDESGDVLFEDKRPSHG